MTKPSQASAAKIAANCSATSFAVQQSGEDFRNWERDAWIAALDANMLTPIALIKATVDGMIARRFGRIVNITSSAVKAPIETLGLSNGARSGLTGFVAELARRTVCHNVTINNLLPGAFDTDRLRSNIAIVAKANGLSPEEVFEELKARNPARQNVLETLLSLAKPVYFSVVLKQATLLAKFLD